MDFIQARCSMFMYLQIIIYLTKKFRSKEFTRKETMCLLRKTCWKIAEKLNTKCLTSCLDNINLSFRVAFFFFLERIPLCLVEKIFLINLVIFHKWTSKSHHLGLLKRDSKSLKPPWARWLLQVDLECTSLNGDVQKHEMNFSFWRFLMFKRI